MDGEMEARVRATVRVRVEFGWGEITAPVFPYYGD